MSAAVPEGSGPLVAPIGGPDAAAAVGLLAFAALKLPAILLLSVASLVVPAAAVKGA